MKNERQANTLQATALVHEVYLRLIDVTKVEWRERAQFFAMAAQMMRRILVDAARAHGAQKRGGSAVTSTKPPSSPARRTAPLWRWMRH
jgi:ECF sigma factor